MCCWLVATFPWGAGAEFCRLTARPSLKATFTTWTAQHDQLLGFFFTGRPDIFYRIEYVEALNEGDVHCLDIEQLSPELIDEYETYGVFDVAVSQPAQPQNFLLKQNHPNPFNPVTQIEYVLGQAVEARLAVYNLQGTVT